MKYKLLLLLISAFLLTGCGQNVEHASSPQETPTQTESSESEAEPFVFTFEATTIDGDTISSDIFSTSKLTMINVWATYCNPCLSEMPDLGEIAGEYEPEIFQMYGIISDVMEGDSADKIKEAKNLIQETNAAYPHLLLNQSLYSNLVSGVSGVPTTFFFNQESELLGYIVGAQSKEAWTALIEDLLSQME